MYGNSISNRNIWITIFLSEENGDRIQPPDIAEIALHNGVIFFRSINPEKVLLYESKESETFEEALMLVNMENSENE